MSLVAFANQRVALEGFVGAQPGEVGLPAAAVYDHVHAVPGKGRVNSLQRIRAQHIVAVERDEDVAARGTKACSPGGEQAFVVLMDNKGPIGPLSRKRIAKGGRAVRRAVIDHDEPQSSKVWERTESKASGSQRSTL